MIVEYVSWVAILVETFTEALVTVSPEGNVTVPSSEFVYSGPSLTSISISAPPSLKVVTDAAAANGETSIKHVNTKAVIAFLLSFIGGTLSLPPHKSGIKYRRGVVITGSPRRGGPDKGHNCTTFSLEKQSSAIDCKPPTLSSELSNHSLFATVVGLLGPNASQISGPSLI